MDGYPAVVEAAGSVPPRPQPGSLKGGGRYLAEAASVAQPSTKAVFTASQLASV